MAKISKKLANELSQDINSLMVWSQMVNTACDQKRYHDAQRNMTVYNKIADKFIALGIPVQKYRDLNSEKV